MACHFRLMEEIDTETRDKLLQGHREIHIPAGHQLILQADWGEETYVVLAGILKARSMNIKGEESVISLMGAGAVIGEIALLAPKPIRSVDVVSVTPSRLAKLRQHAMREMIENNISFIRSIAYLQARRLAAVGERLMLMNEDAMTRLLAILLELAYLSGDGEDPFHPIPSISQQEIAGLAGLSRGTTSTLINKLISSGTMRRRDECLQFITLAALERRQLLPRQPQ